MIDFGASSGIWDSLMQISGAELKSSAGKTLADRSNGAPTADTCLANQCNSIALNSIQ